MSKSDKLGTLKVNEDKLAIDATPEQLKELYESAKKNKDLTVKDLLYQAKYAKDSLKHALIAAHLLDAVKKYAKEQEDINGS